jgi:hypothetical protein
MHTYQYGYIIGGSGAVEYGPGGDEVRESTSGERFYTSPGTVHRDVTPDSEGMLWQSAVGFLSRHQFGCT